MIEPRIYRAAFLPAIVALVLAMFSLESEPPPAPIDLAADVIFQGESVAESAEEIVREHPDRRPGSPGDEAAADLVAGELEERGFDVTDDAFSAEGRALRNVIGTRVGSERERIVILAGRDASSVPDLTGSATDTAALLELATALEGRAPEKTVVLASVDGSTLGDAGTQRFAQTLEDREHVEAALVLSDLGADSPQGPGLVTWSNDASRVSIGLERTAVSALRAEFEEAAGGSGVATQFAQLAFPVGIGAQGVLLDRGIEAIRFSGSGLLPPDPEPDRIDADRVGGVGRAVLQTASAVDSSDGLEHGPASYIRFAGNVVPHWAISMLTLALILPVLVVSVDAFARARRRREPVGSWILWLLARIVPFAIGLLVAILFVVATLAPGLSGAAPPPSQEPLDARAGAILGAVGAAVVLAWIFLRPLLTRWGGAQGDPAAPGAAAALALVVSVITFGAWVTNPYAALALLPAAHLWTMTTLSESPVRRRTAAAVVAAGLALPAAAALVYMLRLSLDPLEALWYLYLLVAGGQVSLAAALTGCVLLGVLGATVEILGAVRRQAEPALAPSPAVRGPGGHAGPGSLGGTRSALRR